MSKMQIFAKVSLSKTIVIDVEQSTTIEEVKQKTGYGKKETRESGF